MDQLKPPSAIEFHSGNVADRWQKWKRQFEIYFDACELGEKSKPTQVAILLHAAGPEAQEIHRAFTWGDGEDKKNLKHVITVNLEKMLCLKDMNFGPEIRERKRSTRGSQICATRQLSANLEIRRHHLFETRLFLAYKT